MPTGGKPALKPDEIKLIAERIMAGAKPKSRLHREFVRVPTSSSRPG